MKNDNEKNINKFINLKSNTLCSNKLKIINVHQKVKKKTEKMI